MLSHLNNLNTDSARFAYRNLGNAARFAVAIAIRNHLAQVRAGTATDDDDTFDANGAVPSRNGEPTMDGANHADTVQGGAEVATMQREDQGYSTNLPPLHRAELLESVAQTCLDEVLAIGGRAPWDTPQTIKEVVDFLSRSEKPRDLTSTQQAAIDRMVASGILQKETVEADRKKDAAKQADNWKRDAEEVFTEYDCLEVPVDAENAFDKLEPWMVIKLMDKTIEGMRRDARRFAQNIAVGKIRDRTPQDAENTVLIVDADADKLLQVRRAYYRQHREAIEANPGQ
jgi:Asp-tRNA(Asn)/Glu-tRNA(Gln) amidotransferase A subunit family amidase